VGTGEGKAPISFYTIEREVGFGLVMKSESKNDEKLLMRLLVVGCD
jgi:CRISPR/Cas system CMR subunit Cmr6 (Cas7 group RAMP superfamily)